MDLIDRVEEAVGEVVFGQRGRGFGCGGDTGGPFEIDLVPELVTALGEQGAGFGDIGNIAGQLPGTGGAALLNPDLLAEVLVGAVDSDVLGRQVIGVRQGAAEVIDHGDPVAGHQGHLGAEPFQFGSADGWGRDRGIVADFELEGLEFPAKTVVLGGQVFEAAPYPVQRAESIIRGGQ